MASTERVRTRAETAADFSAQQAATRQRGTQATKRPRWVYEPLPADAAKLQRVPKAPLEKAPRIMHHLAHDKTLDEQVRQLRNKANDPVAHNDIVTTGKVVWTVTGTATTTVDGLPVKLLALENAAGDRAVRREQEVQRVCRAGVYSV